MHPIGPIRRNVDAQIESPQQQRNQREEELPEARERRQLAGRWLRAPEDGGFRSGGGVAREPEEDPANGDGSLPGRSATAIIVGQAVRWRVSVWTSGYIAINHGLRKPKSEPWAVHLWSTQSAGSFTTASRGNYLFYRMINAVDVSEFLLIHH